MQAQPRKQARPVQQRRRNEPMLPQRHGKAPTHAQKHGMIPIFIPTCHFCGINGHIIPNCFCYIKICRAKSMIEKKKSRAKMYVPMNDSSNLHDPLPSRAIEPLTTRIEIVSPKWIKKDEPACYETNMSPIGSARSNRLGRSLGPHALH